MSVCYFHCHGMCGSLFYLLDWLFCDFLGKRCLAFLVTREWKHQRQLLPLLGWSDADVTMSAVLLLLRAVCEG